MATRIVKATRKDNDEIIIYIISFISKDLSIGTHIHNFRKQKLKKVDRSFN